MTHTHQLYACLALTVYLAPCAWQDWRTRKVSNWLTVPAFIVAWPLAIWCGNLEWTVAVFVGCYVAWQFKGMGAADGKLATLMAAVTPGAIVISTMLMCVAFVVRAFYLKERSSLPAGLYFFFAIVIYGLWWVCLV